MFTSGTSTLRLVIGFLDKLLTDMTFAPELIASTDALAWSLINNFAALGVPQGLDQTQIHDGLRACEDGLLILATEPDLDIDPAVAIQLESTFISIQGDLRDE